MKDFLIICIGASAGAASRYYLDLFLTYRLGSAFPHGTFFVNMTGCLLLGFLGSLALERANLVTPELRLFLAVGFIGSYTTFSTFSLETIRLLEAGHLLRALAYVLGSVLIGLLATYLGLMVARALP